MQWLNYHLADMHTQYPKIGEDIEFSKVLNVKQFPERNLEIDQLGILRPLPQIHQRSNLDNDCSKLT
jgi:hypothetical protein